MHTHVYQVGALEAVDQRKVKALFVNAPKEYRAVIDSVSSNVTVVKDLKKGPVDVIQLFVLQRVSWKNSSAGGRVF